MSLDIMLPIFCYSAMAILMNPLPNNNVITFPPIIIKWCYISNEFSGKVPALDTGSEIIVESLDICDYLDEKYPDPPLYPSDPQTKQADKQLIEEIRPFGSTLLKCVLGIEEKHLNEWMQLFSDRLEVFEKELLKRRTLYFGGTQPGMVIILEIDFLWFLNLDLGGLYVVALGRTSGSYSFEVGRG